MCGTSGDLYVKAAAAKVANDHVRKRFDQASPVRSTL